MEVIYPHCCGLDVHKREVVACVVSTEPDGTACKEVRAFGTMTPDILALADWLAIQEVSHVAMESTGVYWKPIWNLLEDSFALLLVNARHVKAVPGRKTDVRDCEWLAELLRHGLLTGSYVPDRPQRELRELTRYRASLVRERTAAANRLQKTLEGANIKLASVATDILGKSGREILTALVAGETDGAALAQLAQGRLREKLPQLERALVGCVGPHQRFLVAEQVAHVDVLDEAIARVSAEIAARVRSAEEAIARLDTIPGVGPTVAEALVAEIGPNPKRFDKSSGPLGTVTQRPIPAWVRHHVHAHPGPRLLLFCLAASPARSTWPPGPVSVRETMRAQASAGAAAPAREALGCGPASCRPRTPRRGPRAPTWQRSIDGWRPAAARRRRPLRSLIPS
jgi:transposase